MYHRSFAVISAVIVPTASDLANGITFSSDTSLGGCVNGATTSECDPHDPRLGPHIILASIGVLSKPIRMFHTETLACLASEHVEDCMKDLSLG